MSVQANPFHYRCGTYHPHGACPLGDDSRPIETVEPSLFDAPVEPRTLHRVDDPDTSVEAAHRLDAGRAGTIRRQLLATFRTTPRTAESAAIAAGFDRGDGAWKRVSDLLNAGFLEPTGITANGSSGRPQRVLRITDAGRRALA